MNKHKIYEVIAQKYQNDKDYEKAGEFYHMAYDTLNQNIKKNRFKYNEQTMYKNKINLYNYLIKAKICFKNCNTSRTIPKIMECLKLSYSLDKSWTEYRYQLQQDMINIFDEYENTLQYDDKLYCLNLILEILTESNRNTDIHKKYQEKYKNLHAVNISF